MSACGNSVESFRAGMCPSLPVPEYPLYPDRWIRVILPLGWPRLHLHHVTKLLICPIGLHGVKKGSRKGQKQTY